jgi:hypothetical protein
MQRLWDMVVAIEPVLVVLDTLRELHDRKEDLSDEMGPVLRPIRQLAHQTNTTILVNHHQNKAGTFRGSTAIRAAFDLEWAFTRDDAAEQGPAKGSLRVEGRHGPRTALTVRLGEGLRWELDQPLTFPRDPGMRERILAHLARVNAWQTAIEIAQGLGVPLKTVQNTLAMMMREQPQPCTVMGSGTKREPGRYHALAARLNGFDATTGEGMIPPDGRSLGKRSGGYHAGPTGEAGNDRWTR